MGVLSMIIPDLPESLYRLVGRVKFPDGVSGCWIWQGSTTGHHTTETKRARPFYGCLVVNKKCVKSHRFFYEQMKGPIPDGLVLDHLCSTTLCVNPDHLEPVTSQENVRRYFAGISQKPYGVWRSLFCRNGHRRTTETIKILSNGRIRCRVCIREKVKRKLMRRKERTIKTVCVHGHPYEGNRRIIPKTGDSYCIVCNNEQSKRYKRKNK